MERDVHRGRPLQGDVELGGHGARRLRGARLVHQVVRRGPVAVAVEQRSGDPAVQNPVERLVVPLRPPFRDDFVPFDAALDPEAHLVRGPAPEAAVLRRVPVLQALHDAAID